MSEERREHPRMPLSLPVAVRHPDYAEIQVVTGDLSHGGAFLCCNPADFPPVGSKVEIQAIKPAGDGEGAPVVRAVVVRATHAGVGIQFILPGD